MTRKWFALVFVLGTVLFHCAYFNTFYNAKRYYKLADQETRRSRSESISAATKGNFQKAVEKANRVVQEYPKSRYVDDALILMGKALYYQQEYHQSIRKLDQLLLNYPASEYADEARLWKAKSQLGLDNYAQAEMAFQNLFNDEIDRRIQGQAHLFLGKLYEERRSFDQAVASYKQSLKLLPGHMKAEAAFSIGADYDSLGDYQASAQYFQQVLDYDPYQEMRYDAEFRYARSLKKMKRADEAIDLFNALLVREGIQNRVPDIKLEIADALLVKGDVDGSILAYRDVTQEYPRTNHAARAYFALGNIYEKYRHDYERALDNFTETKTSSARSAYADTAGQKARDIQRFLALNQVIQMAGLGEGGELRLAEEDTEEDSMSLDEAYMLMEKAQTPAQKDSAMMKIGGTAFADSIREEVELQERQREFAWQASQNRSDRKPQVDWIEWYKEGIMPSADNLENELILLQKRQERLEQRRLSENPDLTSFRVDELDKNLFFLAELFLFRFDLPDSAFYQYKRIISEFPESEFSARACYNMAYLQNEYYKNPEASDTCYRYLVKHYPETSQAQAASRNLGLSGDETAGQETAVTFFRRAEDALWKRNDPGYALSQYRMLIDTFPESPLVPKSYYTMGWILENRLDNPEDATDIYKKLNQEFPETEYARHVLPKLTTLQQIREAELARIDSASAAVADTLTLKRPQKQDSLAVPESQSVPDTLMPSIEQARPVPPAVDLNSDTLKIPGEQDQTGIVSPGNTEHAVPEEAIPPGTDQ